MGILDDAIREHLDLKRKHGAREDEVRNLEDSAFGGGDLPDPFASGDLFGQVRLAGELDRRFELARLVAAARRLGDEEPTRIVEPPTAPQAQPPDPARRRRRMIPPPPAPEPTPPTPRHRPRLPRRLPSSRRPPSPRPREQVPLDVREAPAPFDFDAAEPPGTPPRMRARAPGPTGIGDPARTCRGGRGCRPRSSRACPEPEPPPPAPEPPSPAPEPEPSESLADLLAEEDLEPQPPEEMDVADRARAAAPEPPPPPPLSAEGTRPTGHGDVPSDPATG